MKNKTKSTPQKNAKKFEQELPEVAKRHNIRVSNPYGYYPEDVDKIILALEKDISNLTKENSQLSKDLYTQKQMNSSLQTELSQIKMQVSLMDIPDASTEENFAMLSRMSTINGQNQEIPTKTISEVKPINIKTVNIPQPKNSNTVKQDTYNNLVKPKIKL